MALGRSIRRLRTPQETGGRTSPVFPVLRRKPTWQFDVRAIADHNIGVLWPAGTSGTLDPDRDTREKLPGALAIGVDSGNVTWPAHVEVRRQTERSEELVETVNRAIGSSCAGLFPSRCMIFVWRYILEGKFIKICLQRAGRSGMPPVGWGDKHDAPVSERG